MASREEQGAHADFLAEAQELVEALSRDLLLYEQSERGGSPSHEVLSDLFRAVHTLKGLSSMFGHAELARAAHLLEDVLQDLRLGEVAVSEAVLDRLFEGVDLCARLLAKSPSHPDATQELEVFARGVHALGRRARPTHDPLEELELDGSVREVLTEYEEHRLRENVAAGTPIVRARARFSLERLEAELGDARARLSKLGEILSYLPAAGGGLREDELEMDLLLATRAEVDALRAALPHDTQVAHVPRRTIQMLAVQPMASQDERSFERGGPALAAEASAAPVSSLVRVDIRKLDHLMNAVGELGSARAAFMRLLDKLRPSLDPELSREAQRIARLFSRRLADVRDGVLDVRMVPLAQIFEKVAVHVRRLAREQGKLVRLVVTGSDTEVDKLIAEEIADPLLHLVRNAIDHGIEPAEERRAGGKTETATVKVHAYPKGTHVVIELEDDGRGIDPEAVRKVAVHKGLLGADLASELSPRELLDVIFLPGFSTRDAITDLSGRGVGLDVVKTNLTRLGGAVVVDSELGRGTRATLTLPITLAMIGALLFSVRGRTFALPLSVVEEALRLEPAAVRTVEGRPVLCARGATLPLCRLGDLLRLPAQGEVPRAAFVVIVRVGARRLGLVVDRLLGQQDIVVKGLGPSLQDVRGISGAADLGDAELLLVLDAPSIVEEVLTPRAVPLALGGVQ